MKKRLAVWVIFVIIRLPLSLDPSFAPSLLAQPGLGAASIAKGGVSLGDPNPLWALWNDPSGLVGFDLDSFELDTSGLDSAGLAKSSFVKSELESTKAQPSWNGLGIMVHRPFGLAELDQRVLSTVWTSPKQSDSARAQAWGVGLYDSGDEIFRESKLRLGWATATTDWPVT